MVLLLATGVWAATPQRIISAMPSITEILFALELDDRIVGVTTNCNYPEEAQKKEKIGGFFLNLEKVVSLKPDLLIMAEDAQKKDIKKFKKYGLPVFTIRTTSIKEVMRAIYLIGKKTGKKDAAKKLLKTMQERIDKVTEYVSAFQPGIADVLKLWNPGVKQRKALVIVGFNPLVVAGGGTFVDDILKFAKVENIAAKTRSAYSQYSFEKLVADNPQYIIIPGNIITKKQLQEDKRWRSLEAVRNGQILFIDPDILSRPGPRVVDAIEVIAGFVYN